MRVIDPGHDYSLNKLDVSIFYVTEERSRLRFVKRIGPTYPGNTSYYSGTQMQEVLRALIDRITYLDNQKHSWTNIFNRLLFRLSLWLLEYRNLRKKRLGLFLWVRLKRIEHIPFCKLCGHIVCYEHKGEYE